VAEQQEQRKERVKETRAAYRARRARPADAVVADWQWVEMNRERLEERYAGRWIAVAGERVVGAGVKLPTAIRQAKKAGIEHPFVTAFRKAEYRGAIEVPHWL
jgi:transposase InsO family protein